MNKKTNEFTAIKRKSIKHSLSNSTATLLLGVCLAFAVPTQSSAEEIAGPLKINTPKGYIQIGPTNSSNWARFLTDRPRYFFDTEIRVDTGKIGSFDEDLKLRIQGTTRIQIKKSTGNVGIGTTNPKEKLHVNGNGRFAGTVLVMPGGDIPMGEFDNGTTP